MKANTDCPLANESRIFEELLHTVPPPEWLLDMHDHYARKGSFRTEDVLRVLGDPRKGVEMGTEESIRAYFGLDAHSPTLGSRAEW